MTSEISSKTSQWQNRKLGVHINFCFLLYLLNTNTSFILHCTLPSWLLLRILPFICPVSGELPPCSCTQGGHSDVGAPSPRPEHAEPAPRALPWLTPGSCCPLALLPEGPEGSPASHRHTSNNPGLCPLAI